MDQKRISGNDSKGASLAKVVLVASGSLALISMASTRRPVRLRAVPIPQGAERPYGYRLGLRGSCR